MWSYGKLMLLVQVREKTQVTIPIKIRKALGSFRGRQKRQDKRV